MQADPRLGHENGSRRIGHGVDRSLSRQCFCLGGARRRACWPMIGLSKFSGDISHRLTAWRLCGCLS